MKTSQPNTPRKSIFLSNSLQRINFLSESGKKKINGMNEKEKECGKQS